MDAPQSRGQDGPRHWEGGLEGSSSDQHPQQQTSTARLGHAVRGAGRGQASRSPQTSRGGEVLHCKARWDTYKA